MNKCKWEELFVTLIQIGDRRVCEFGVVRIPRGRSEGSGSCCFLVLV